MISYCTIIPVATKLNQQKNPLIEISGLSAYFYTSINSKRISFSELQRLSDLYQL
jgi:hypothetical protein